MADYADEGQSEDQIVQGAGETIEDVQDSPRLRTDLWHPGSDNGQSAEAAHGADRWESARVDPRGAVERGINGPYSEPVSGRNRTEPERLMTGHNAAGQRTNPEQPKGGSAKDVEKHPKTQTPPEQPGQDNANPVPHALTDDPFKDPPGQPSGTSGTAD